MTLKTCIGGLLPTGLKAFTTTMPPGRAQATASHWVPGAPPLVPRKTGGWHPVPRYDGGGIFRGGEVLVNLPTMYPGAECYEIAGFFGGRAIATPAIWA